MMLHRHFGEDNAGEENPVKGNPVWEITAGEPRNAVEPEVAEEANTVEGEDEKPRRGRKRKTDN